jgi:dTDP-4-amino-4,6-dideoxy-D-galactose acyltransferase
MIKELVWDSAFFGRKIGELIVSNRESNIIEAALKKAKADGFQYVICKIYSRNNPLMNQLRSLDFYLLDIGVTCAIDAGSLSTGMKKSSSAGRQFIRAADDHDIRALKKTAQSLFTDGRFYHDPFFSKKEADKLYKTWIENAVRGDTADIVWYIPDTGCVACQISGNRRGNIVLIGVQKNFRRKGFGSVLMEKALKWFQDNGIRMVSVRTSARSLDAINFYLRSGFYIQKYDYVFARIM